MIDKTRKVIVHRNGSMILMVKAFDTAKAYLDHSKPWSKENRLSDDFLKFWYTKGCVELTSPKYVNT